MVDGEERRKPGFVSKRERTGDSGNLVRDGGDEGKQNPDGRRLAIQRWGYIGSSGVTLIAYAPVPGSVAQKSGLETSTENRVEGEPTNASKTHSCSSRDADAGLVQVEAIVLGGFELGRCRSRDKRETTIGRYGAEARWGRQCRAVQCNANANAL